MGVLDFGTFHGPCERSLQYLSQKGTGVRVLFADGRPFIDVDLSRGGQRSTYHCGHDLYVISFVIHSEDVLCETWRTRGPTKDYEATTTLTREHNISQGQRARGATA
jgi:hypothetical protein